jgi:hypothetical protein
MRSNYDDLMGLDMYDEGMGEMYNAQSAQEDAIAAGSSAIAILLGAWAMPKMPAPKDWTPENQHRMRAALAVLAGIVGSRMLIRYGNRDAAMAVLGGVGGLGIAQLVDSYLTPDKDGKRLLTIGTPFGEYGAYPDAGALSAGDEALLTAYSRDTGTLSALELTNVAAARGAFAGFAGPVVTNEALMGAVVQAETLGDGGYNAYLS